MKKYVFWTYEEVFDDLLDDHLKARAEGAVDQEVDGGVDHQQKVAEAKCKNEF